MRSSTGSEEHSAVGRTERRHKPEAPEGGEPRPSSQRNPQKGAVTVKSPEGGGGEGGVRETERQNRGVKRADVIQRL